MLTILVLFPPLFNTITDPRDHRKITYPIPAIIFTAFLMFYCHLRSRRQIHLLLNTAASAQKFEALFSVNGIPHGDTVNKTFTRLSVDQFQEVVCSMVQKLIRNKVLAPYTVMGKYYTIAVDGTGVMSFEKRHCEHCMTRKTNGKTIYYHPVLEAKLVTQNGFAFSIMTEFIENEAIINDKQDCELKAFYRLAERLKQRFPRLPILLSLDGLYAGGPTFSLCTKYNWKYMIVLTDKDLKSVNTEFEALIQLQTDNHLTWITGKDSECRQEYTWTTDIEYEDSKHSNHTLTVLQCLETNRRKGTTSKKFKWVTNLDIQKKNVVSVANQGGRDRWKVENQGFNTQKNGGYELEHIYSTDPTAAKIFYYILQIAHIITQLINKGSMLKKLITTPFGSQKNCAFRFLEAWRNLTITTREIDNFLKRKIQIRFDTS